MTVAIINQIVAWLYLRMIDFPECFCHFPESEGAGCSCLWLFLFSGLFKHPSCRLMMSSLVWPGLVESFQGPSGVPLCHVVGMAELFFCVLDKESFPMLCSSTVSHLCEAPEQMVFSIGISWGITQDIVGYCCFYSAIWKGSFPQCAT